MVGRSRVTLGRKALVIRYMLRTLTFIVKSQSASSQSRMEPWCTKLGENNNKPLWAVRQRTAWNCHIYQYLQHFLEPWTLGLQYERKMSSRGLLCLGAVPSQPQSSGFNPPLSTAQPVGILEHDAFLTYYLDSLRVALEKAECWMQQKQPPHYWNGVQVVKEGAMEDLKSYGLRV